MAKLLLSIFIICSSHAINLNLAENLASLETDDSGTNFVSFANLTLNETSIPSSTTPMPEPPVVERIEIRLIDGENTTQETSLIIVDVVKKNGSGVAATIQQQHDSLDSKQAKPNFGFLLRVRQPNYQSVSYIPFEKVTIATTEQTTTLTELVKINATIEPTETIKHEIETTKIAMEENVEDSLNATTESPGIGEMIQIVRFEDLLYGITTTTNVPISTHENGNGANEDAEYQEGIGTDSLEHQNTAEEREDFQENHNGESHSHDREETNEHLFVEEDDHSSEIGLNHSDRWALEMSMNGHQNWTAMQNDMEMDEVEMETMANNNEGEECLANRAMLPNDVVERLVNERRRIVQAIKKINKHQMLLCRPDQDQNQVPYRFGKFNKNHLLSRKCPMWRREKFFLYYALMRITYCGNHAQWPGGRRFRAV